VQTECSSHSTSLYYMKECGKLNTLTVMSQLGKTLDLPKTQPRYCSTERNPACQESGRAQPATSLTEIFKLIIQTMLSQLHRLYDVKWEDNCK
jgi:hypothetical protein